MHCRRPYGENDDAEPRRTVFCAVVRPKEVKADEELAFVENNNAPFRLSNEELPQ